MLGTCSRAPSGANASSIERSVNIAIHMPLIPMTSSLPTPRATPLSHIEHLVKELADSDSETRELVVEQVSAYIRKFDTILNTDAKHTTYTEGRATRLNAAVDQYLHQEAIRVHGLNTADRSTQLAAALGDVHTLATRLRHDSPELASFYTGQPAALHFHSQQSGSSPQPASRPRLEAISTAKYDYDSQYPFPLSSVDDASFSTEPDSPFPSTPLDPIPMTLLTEFLSSFRAPSAPLDLSCPQTLSTRESSAIHRPRESKRDILSRLDDIPPGVTSLSINVPFSRPPLLGPSSSPACQIPRLSYLLIDEADSALWTPDRMITTLEVLQAEHIRDLRIRNASRATVRHCVKFTDSIRACVLADGFLHFVDYSDMELTFFGAAGQYITSDSFLFCKMFLWTLKTLTLGAWMLPQELDLLFGTGCFPRGLETLRVWHGGTHSSPEERTQLLAYRASGWSCCLGLSRLCLTTTRPLDDIPCASASDNLTAPQVATVVSLELIRDFLEHVHGREVVVWRDVELELDGVLASTGGRGGVDI